MTYSTNEKLKSRSWLEMLFTMALSIMFQPTMCYCKATKSNCESVARAQATLDKTRQSDVFMVLYICKDSLLYNSIQFINSIPFRACTNPTPCWWERNCTKIEISFRWDEIGIARLWLQNRRLRRRLWCLSQQLLSYLKTLCWYAMHLLAMTGINLSSILFIAPCRYHPTSIANAWRT